MTDCLNFAQWSSPIPSLSLQLFALNSYYVVCWKLKLRDFIRSLQHSMENFYREFPQLRCTELQLKMRLAGLDLQLKRVAHEQNTRLAVSSRPQRGSVAGKWVFCEGVSPFEVAAGRPTEFSISSDNLGGQLRGSQNLRDLGANLQL